MKPTHAINVTGNPNFEYKASNLTNLADKFKKLQRDYNRAWDDAHAENAARDAAERKAKVRTISVRP